MSSMARGDPFLALVGLRVIGRMRGVATTKVEGVDHLIRVRLAQAIVAKIENPTPPTTLIRVIS